MRQDAEPLAGYREPYGGLCAILNDATEDWRGELSDEPAENLGADVMTWRVRPDGQTIGAVLLHMGIVEYWWFQEFVLGRDVSPELKKTLMWGKINVDKGIWPDPPAEPMSWYLALLDECRARMLEVIKEWPAPDVPIEMKGVGRSCTPRWVLGHVIQHESYHGGQVVMLQDLWKHQESS
jgi:uncharacterized damage-inducible protein DinB